MQTRPCAECGGTMQVGYTLDRADGSAPTQAAWIQGEPQTAKFLGMNAGLTVRDRARYDIVTLRCEQCGLLRSYARPEDRCG
jgi:hypothetical protein